MSNLPLTRVVLIVLTLLGAAHSEEAPKQKRTSLGVQLELGEQKGGILVGGVTKDGPAAKAGLKVGDRLVQIDDAEQTDPTAVGRAIRSLKPGKKVKLLIRRDGKERTLEAVLGEETVPEVRPATPPAPPKEVPKERRTFLGIGIYADAKKGSIVVAHVAEDSAAEKAGVKKGDRLVKIDDAEPADAAAVVRAIQSLKPGKKVKLLIRRGDKEITLEAVLGEVLR